LDVASAAAAAGSKLPLRSDIRRVKVNAKFRYC
jgi:hypothetical protein